MSQQCTVMVWHRDRVREGRKKRRTVWRQTRCKNSATCKNGTRCWQHFDLVLIATQESV